MSDATSFNLAGKDWFTELEAAFYCGVSSGHFAKHYADLGISPRRFMGKKLFSRIELSRVIEMSDPWNPVSVTVAYAPMRATSDMSPELRAAYERLANYERRQRLKKGG